MLRTATKWIVVAAMVFLTVGCGSEPEQIDPALDLERALQGVIDSVVDGDQAIHGAALAVIAPSLGLEWEGAAGMADPAAGTAMTPGNPVRIASNTKTYVAAAFLRLAEDGRLDLNDPIGEHLPVEFVEILKSDGYDPGATTIRHLLTHTSGLYDHGEAAAYTEAIIADPEHRWTPFEQLTFTVDWGSPHAAPGTVYSYSDSGYVLLGQILQRATGLPLSRAVRELVGFEGLGLASTWWETLEPEPAGVADRAHQFYGDLDVHGFDPSFDLYGGGGLVATMGDLGRFFDGLFRDRVYDDPKTIDIMLSSFDDLDARPDASERSLAPGAYRMGVWVLETGGFTTYHHTGFWGTMAVHAPDLDLTVAATVNQNQSKPVFDTILRETIAIVEDAIS